jgi:FAD/FMN-containing dehydrogenase
VALRARADLSDPLSETYPVYVLMELSASGGVDLAGMMESALADAGDTILDGVIAKSLAQSERMWLYREIMVEAQGNAGRYLRTDVSIPISMLADFLTEALAKLHSALPHAKPVSYGHVGDGNIHLNVAPASGFYSRTGGNAFRGSRNDHLRRG